MYTYQPTRTAAETPMGQKELNPKLKEKIHVHV